MSVHLIEIHDAGVRVLLDGKVVCASPGVAVIEKSEVIVGRAAEARAHFEPRAVNTRFWQQLNETPLRQKNRKCRHHADLAYHHLSAVLAEAGRPDEAIIAVPSTFEPQQLALLLGIAAACGLRVSGLVDYAVAALAGTAAPGAYAVAELYQHHAAVTSVRVGEKVRREAVVSIDQSGLSRIHEACVDLIADAFLEQSRFDPLHEAATEQLLYTHLPGWLNEARTAGELSLAIEYDGARFAARIPVREILRITEMVLAPVAEAVPSDSMLVLAPWLARQPGAVSHLPDSITLPENAVQIGTSQHRLALGTGKDGVAFTLELPRTTKPTLESRASESVPHVNRAARGATHPTHVLGGAIAHALTPEPLNLSADGKISRAGAQPVPCSLAMEGPLARLKVSSGSVLVNGRHVADDCTVLAGDRISFDGGQAAFMAIRVED